MTLQIFKITEVIQPVLDCLLNMLSDKSEWPEMI